MDLTCGSCPYSSCKFAGFYSHVACIDHPEYDVKLFVEKMRKGVE